VIDGAAGQRHAATAGAQGVKSLRDGNQRGGAGGVDADRRTGEVELVRDARGQIVLLVGQHHLELAELVDQVGPATDVLLEIAGVVHAAEDADRHVLRIGNVAAALEAFPAQLQEQSLLRIHQLCFARRHAEEAASNSSTPSITPRAAT
jgi:hypothetical protein